MVGGVQEETDRARSRFPNWELENGEGVGAGALHASRWEYIETPG